MISTQLSSCMDNEPPAMEKLGLVLPGKMMSLDEQCRSVYGQDSYACDVSYIYSPINFALYHHYNKKER